MCMDNDIEMPTVKSTKPQTPLLTVDIFIIDEITSDLVLVKRKNEPQGWALPESRSSLANHRTARACGFARTVGWITSLQAQGIEAPTNDGR